MRRRTFHASGSRSLMAGTLLLVAAGTLVSTAVNPFGGGKGAQLAKHLNNVRQVKFALDGFSTDFDGQYPNLDTGQRVVEGGTGDKFSNNYFRQLFMAGETGSESIFWVKGASVCAEDEPDNDIGTAGKPVAAEILKAGDCGWAYMTGQTNTSNVARALILDAFQAGTKEFDKKLWDGKVIVLRIDGSVGAIEINDDGKVLTEGEDLLSATSRAWKGSGEDPTKLLKQPEPVAAPVAKPAPQE